MTDERKPTYEELKGELEKRNKISTFIWFCISIAGVITGAAIMAYCGCNLFQWFAGTAIMALFFMLFILLIAIELRDEIRRCAKQ